MLHGLFRVRAFTQDDAHIFCRLDQVEDEVRRGPRPHRPLLRALRLRATCALKLVDPPREGERRRRRCGTRAEEALRAALGDRPTTS